MGKITVKANHPVYNSLGVKGFPRRVDCGEEITADENVLRCFGMKNFTVVSGKKTKDIPGDTDKKESKAMTTKDGKKK